MKRKFMLAAMLTGALASAPLLSFAGEASPGTLEDLQIEDVAKLVDVTFREDVTEYNIDVFLDVFGVKFTPSISEGGTIEVTVEGQDGLLNVLNTEDEEKLGKTSLVIENGEEFEARLTEKRECVSQNPNDPTGSAANSGRGMEDDQDYVVTITTADQTYTVNIHRDGTDPIVEQFELKDWELEGGDIQEYLLYVPADYDPAKKYPLLLAPHGSGQKTNPAEDILVRTAQATAPVYYGKDMIILAPQANVNTLDAEDAAWKYDDLSLTRYGEGAIDILKDVMANYSVDENRVYVGGASMGGGGTIAFLTNYPELFAGAIIGSGGTTSEELAEKFAQAIQPYDIGIAFAHAEEDPVVNVQQTYTCMEVFDRLGIPYRATIYPAGTYLKPTPHFSWVPFFDNEENIDWLLSQSKE